MANLSEELQFRVTKDGKVHRWRRNEKPPVEARWDICPHCNTKLKATKTEFAGKKGKIDRDYRCPKCGKHGRLIKRQRVKDSRHVLKEPERRST